MVDTAGARVSQTEKVDTAAHASHGTLCDTLVHGFTAGSKVREVAPACMHKQ